MMFQTKRRLAIFTLLVLLQVAFLHGQCSTALATEQPKNIILFIGDGMGVSQATAGKIAKGRLQLERFPVGGLMTMHAKPQFVTDSAASGTAMATGVKTYNGVISVTRDQNPLKTVVRNAEETCMSTSLFVTCTITHATSATAVSRYWWAADEDTAIALVGLVGYNWRRRGASQPTHSQA